MKLIMIGTPVCVKCKTMAPLVEDHCKEHNIEYEYMNLGDAPKDILKILQSHNIRQAPAYILYNDDMVEYVGNEVMSIITSLFENNPE